MTTDTMYATHRSQDVTDYLDQIINLSKLGAASTDTALNIRNLDDAQCSLFEVIHRLASEAVMVAPDTALAQPNAETAEKQPVHNSHSELPNC